MSETLERIRQLVRNREVKISDHGYDEPAEDGIFAKNIVPDVKNAMMVEDYPEYPKGPWVLVLRWDRDGKPIHVVWKVPNDELSPAVVVTSYRPDPGQWTADFLTRRK